MLLLALAIGAMPMRVMPAAAQKFEVESFTLANGMQIVVLPNHRVPAVTQTVWYRVGAADDPRGKSGIAHFLEHLMFKGTKTTAPGEFSKLDRAGRRAGQRVHRGGLHRLSPDRRERSAGIADAARSRTA